MSKTREFTIITWYKMQKYLSIISVLLLLAALLTIWLSPAISPALGMISLLFSLALFIHAIFEKHKGTENARPKILKEMGVMVLTLITIIFLGGIVALLANFYVRASFGEVVGLVSALGASLIIGYVVKKGIVRLAM